MTEFKTKTLIWSRKTIYIGEDIIYTEALIAMNLLTLVMSLLKYIKQSDTENMAFVVRSGL